MFGHLLFCIMPSIEILCVHVHVAISLHEDPNSQSHVEMNNACGSYVYTMGILYRRIPGEQTEQLVNLSRRYMSTKPMRRLLNQETVKVTVF